MSTQRVTQVSDSGHSYINKCEGKSDACFQECQITGANTNIHFTSSKRKDGVSDLRETNSSMKRADVAFETLH